MIRQIRGARIAALAAALAAAALAGHARADFVLASNFPSGSTFSGSAIYAGDTYAPLSITNEGAAQEFKASAGGTIGTIVASVDKFTPGGESLTVSIYTAPGNTFGTLLGAMNFDPSLFSTNAETTPATLDFTSQHISLAAGSTYFITFTVATPVGPDPAYRALLLNTSGSDFGYGPLYTPDGGTTWRTEGVPNEIGLTINAVPEPSSLALAGVAVSVGLAIARARRGRRAP